MIGLAKHFLNEQIGRTNKSLDVYMEMTAENTIYQICQGLQTNLGHGGLFLLDGKENLSDRYMAENPDVKVVVSPHIKSIGASCFADCHNLKYVRFGFSLNEIKEKAFFNCESLETVVLSAVKKLGSQVFNGCPIKSIFFNGTIAEWNSAEKAEDWYAGSDISAVICKDGTIRI